MRPFAFACKDETPDLRPGWPGDEPRRQAGGVRSSHYGPDARRAANTRSMNRGAMARSRSSLTRPLRVM